MATASALLRLKLQAYAEHAETWGHIELNAVMELIEEAIASTTSKALTGASSTLTATNYVADEARDFCLVFTGTPDSGHIVTIPSSKKIYLVFNDTNVTINLKTSGGSAVSLAAGDYQIFNCYDGTEIRKTSWATNSGIAAAVALAFTALSSSSVAIGTGSKSFTLTASDKAFSVGQVHRIADAAAPGTNYMIGTVTAYAGTAITYNVTVTAGSGTISSWTIGIETSGTNKFITRVNSVELGTRSAVNFVATGLRGADDSGGDEVEVYIPMPFHPGHATGRYYAGFASPSGTDDLDPDIEYSVPMIVGQSTVFTEIGINVTVAQSGKYARLGIRKVADGIPSTLILDAGTVDLSTTGAKTITISQRLEPGLYALSCVSDATTAEVTVVGNSVVMMGGTTLSLTGSGGCWYVSQAYGALPSSYAGSPSYANACPHVWLRKV